MVGVLFCGIVALWLGLSVLPVVESLRQRLYLQAVIIGAVCIGLPVSLTIAAFFLTPDTDEAENFAVLGYMFVAFTVSAVATPLLGVAYVIAKRKPST